MAHANPSMPLGAQTESPRERAELHREERRMAAERALPWKVALAVLFLAWVVMHAVLWHQRGFRPRYQGLDAQLTMARWLTASAFLWVFLYPLFAYVWNRRRAQHPKPRMEAQVLRPERDSRGSHDTRDSRSSHDTNHSETDRCDNTDGESRAEELERRTRPRTHPLAVLALWVLPCSAALLGAVIVFGARGVVVVPAFASLSALLVLLPWLPVVAMLRRAFPARPGDRGELVMASLLIFGVVGLGQAFLNRGFYDWKYRNYSVQFELPVGATFQDRATGILLPRDEPLGDETR